MQNIEKTIMQRGMGSENEQYIIVCKGDCGYRDGLSIMEIK